MSNTSTIDSAADSPAVPEEPKHPLLRERDAAMDLAREAVASEAGALSVLVLADRVAAALISPYTSNGCKVATVSQTGAIEDDVARAIVHDKDGGVPVYTWFSHEQEARRLARRLHGALPGGVAGHVTLVDPATWTGATPSFDEALAGAKPDMPVTLRKQPDPAAGNRRSRVVVGDDEGQFEVHSTRAAEWLLLDHPDKLLVVTDDQEVLSDLYVLGRNGVWVRGDTTLKVWLREIADDMRARAATSGLSDKALQSQLQQLRRLYEPDTIIAVRKSATSALQGLIANKKLQPDEVTTCLADELNADLRYIGTLSGVVDLHDATLLLPDQGRKALVTVMAPVEYHPGATDEDVDRLFAHLPDEAQSWWWKVLGYHLLGQPSRRFYVVEGPRKGGKSTLAEALVDVLGPYASVPSEDALMSLTTKTGGLAPDMEAFVLPTRLVVADEPGAVRISNALLKKLSGDTRITWSKKYQPMRTDPVTGTVMMLCNPGTRPRLNLQDPAMEDRVRKLLYPTIPENDLDPGFKLRTRGESFREALFAALVAAATKQKPGHAPATARYVAEATAAMVVDDIGEVGMFARRLVPAPGNVLSFAAVWSEWCKYNDEDPRTSKDPGGITNRKLGSLLKRHVPDLPQAKQISTQGNKVRGWRHWQLLDEVPEPARQPEADSFADASYELLPDHAASAGTPMTGSKLMAELYCRGAGMRLVTWTSPVVIDGQTRDVTFEESAELYRVAIEQSRLGGRVVDPPPPALGAKRYAVIERSASQDGGDQRPPDTETAPLFPGGEGDPHPAATEAAKQFDGLY